MSSFRRCGNWQAECTSAFFQSHSDRGIGFLILSLASLKKGKPLSLVRLFVIPCTVALQALLSMEFSRPEYWIDAFSFSQNMTHFHMVLAVYRGCRGRRKETCAPLSRGFYTHALKLNTGPRGHHVMCSFHVLITESKPRNKPLWVVCSVLQ